MSMRYADISSPTEINMPAMPSLGAVLIPSRGREAEEVVKPQTDDTRFNDNVLLDKEDFDPDACE